MRELKNAELTEQGLEKLKRSYGRVLTKEETARNDCGNCFFVKKVIYGHGCCNECSCPAEMFGYDARILFPSEGD